MKTTDKCLFIINNLNLDNVYLNRINYNFTKAKSYNFIDIYEIIKNQGFKDEATEILHVIADDYPDDADINILLSNDFFYRGLFQESNIRLSKINYNHLKENSLGQQLILKLNILFENESIVKDKFIYIKAFSLGNDYIDKLFSIYNKKGFDFLKKELIFDLRDYNISFDEINHVDNKKDNDIKKIINNIYNEDIDEFKILNIKNLKLF